MHRILGLPIGGMDIESLLVQEGPNEGLENKLNFTIGKDKMISIIPLKKNLLNLRTIGMEFQVKFILYITAKFMCSTMKYTYRRCWVPILCDTKKLGQLNWSEYIADFLENGIKLRSTYDRASVSGCMLLLATVINKRVRKLRELGLFSGVDVDMVDALGPRKDVAELEALRSRLDSFGADVIEVKNELKTKLVTPMSVPSWLAEDIDCPIVAEDAAVHDTNEDTVSAREIDEVDEICAKIVVNDEEVAECIKFDRPLRRSARNIPPNTRIIKGLRSVRMQRREAAKELGKCVVNVTDTSSKEARKLPSRVLSKKKMMIDLQRLTDVVKSEILQNLWDLKKDPSESVVKRVLHDCNRKQLHFLKLREWVDGEKETQLQGKNMVLVIWF
ncbi:hypothetical protein M9H77_09647 [Catharanthus roseus]|uniref:Uncharacterized protein n=1 Tax=Catharanthus roseus TaxID=4058 RepID=A0ACC0C166_CATRO|nr:hypothetical protein M9H77_09647 [Catharanthus roseus]